MQYVKCRKCEVKYVNAISTFSEYCSECMWRMKKIAEFKEIERSKKMNSWINANIELPPCDGLY